MKVVHLCQLEKFIPPFIEFVNQEVVRDKAEAENQLFLVFGKIHQFQTVGDNVVYLDKSLASLVRLVKELNRAQKIILHGLFNDNIVRILFFQPWLLGKCHWMIWGGDLYDYQKPKVGFAQNVNESLRRVVVKRIGYLLTYLKGDYELAQRWYAAKGKYVECFGYLSNVYHPISSPIEANGKPIIWLGNSADPSNCHAEIFSLLQPKMNCEADIYCPLSYGDADYAKEVSQLGRRYFGEQFKPLHDVVPFTEYLRLLARVSVAVFAHKRQQAMGNTISLLGLGKKVVLREDVPQFRLFQELGVTVYGLNDFSIEPPDQNIADKNMEVITQHFSRRNLQMQWRSIILEPAMPAASPEAT